MVPFATSSVKISTSRLPENALNKIDVKTSILKKIKMRGKGLLKVGINRGYATNDLSF